jgi:hypothetical protein
MTANGPPRPGVKKPTGCRRRLPQKEATVAASRAFDMGIIAPVPPK